LKTSWYVSHQNWQLTAILRLPRSQRHPSTCIVFRQTRSSISVPILSYHAEVELSHKNPVLPSWMTG